MGQNIFFNNFCNLRGPGGLQWSDWTYLAFQLSSHPYLCTCEIREQSDTNFISSNTKYEQNIIFPIWGVLGPGLPNFHGSKTSSQSRQIYNKENKITTTFSYMGSNVKKCTFWAIRGRGGGAWVPMNNQTGPILLPSYPLTYINLHMKYGSNPIRIF